MTDPLSLFDRIEAALKDTQGADLFDQTCAVRAAVAQHEFDRRKHGEPTLFEAPDDDRAQRLVANRLRELTQLTEKQCRTLGYALIHTLEADGFRLARSRHAGEFATQRVESGGES